ncbi:hypothetical protein AMECASPLE_026576 [Ameca splendens]|uniref:Uncharacterized protein n=1 Tax=Ameca splendens TaxID=208324 RepID=A0ABV0XHW8_9TELE
MRTTVSIHVGSCQLESSFISWRHEHNSNSHLHINTNTGTQQASGSSDWLIVVSVSNQEACHHSPPTEKLQLYWKHWIFALMLTGFRTILLTAAGLTLNIYLHIIQFVVWTPYKIYQLLNI